MKIIDRIEQIHQTVIADPTGAGKALADALQDLGAQAILRGIGSDKWREFMANFRSNDAQFARLNGEDAAYMATPWGPRTLAYMVANSTCADTTTSYTKNHMNFTMINGLDAGIPPDHHDPADGLQPLDAAPAFVDM